MRRKAGRPWLFFTLFVASIGALCGPAVAACPGSSLTNGTIANANDVMTWLNCKAPLDSANFSGNIGIGAASLDSGLTISREGANYGQGLYLDIYSPNPGFGGSATLTRIYSARGTAGNQYYFTKYVNASGLQHTVDSAGDGFFAGELQVGSLASASATALCITSTTSGTLATCSSSIRYKEQVQDAPFGLKEVGLMRPVIFKWKGRTERDFGLIAEEVAAVNPLFVTRKDGKIEGVKYPQLTAVLIAAVKQQQAEISELEAQNRELGFRLARLERRATDREKMDSRERQ